MRIRAGENAELRRRHGQRPTAAERIVEAHQAAPHQRIIGLVERANTRDLVDRALLQMVLQIAADALAVEHRLDPKRREPVGRADAGSMQYLERSNRAGAQDHFAFGAGLDDISPFNEAHAGGPPLLDDQAIDQHVLFETQIGTLQRGLQEAARCRPAASALLVDMEIADALIVAGVEIRNFWNAHLFRGLADGVQDHPGQPRSFDPPAAARAMMLAFAEKMILQPAERRLDVIPTPAAEAKLAPVVVVGGLAAH